jgi:hypothetical protein
MRLRQLLASVVAGLIVQMTAAVCCAQSTDVTTGRVAFERAALDVAAQAFHRVLEDPAATRTDIVDAHRYLSTIRLAQDDAAGAEAHATMALALNPDARAPDGASPDVNLLFARVRAHRGRVLLSVGLTLVRPLIAGGETTVRAEVAGLPSGQRVRLSARCTSDGAEVASARADRYATPLQLRIPPLADGAGLECVATLGMPAGSVLERQSMHAIVGRGTAMASDLAATTSAPAPTSRPVVIGAVAAGVLILGAIVVLIVAATQPYDARFAGPIRLEGP